MTDIVVRLRDYDAKDTDAIMDEAAAEIEVLRYQLVSAQRAMNFCEWLKGYFQADLGRDELTAFEANSIRAKFYGEVYPPTTPTPVTDEQGSSK